MFEFLFEFCDHPHEYQLSPTNPQLSRDDTVHCQKGIPGHNLNGLCVEDTRPIVPYLPYWAGTMATVSTILGS